MYDLLINPPLYAYTPDGICELPVALLKLSTHLKAQGSEVAMFDFAPIHHFKGGDVMESHGMRLRKRRRLDLPIYNYKDQKYPQMEYSHMRRTGEYVSRFGRICDRFYLGADKAIFIEFLSKRKPDRIWVSSSLTYHYKGTVDCIDWCKEVYPDVPVHLGGIYPTLCYEHAKANTKADVVYEGKMDAWCNTPMDWDVLPNTPPCIVRIISHGCPNACRFCAVSYMDGKIVKFVDIDRDIEEVRQFGDKYKCYNMRMWGSNVLLPEGGKIFEKWLDMMAALPHKFRITCPEGFAPELLTQNLCDKIRAAGFIEIEIPIESVGLLSDLRKRYDVDAWKRAIGYAKKAGFAPEEIRTAVIPGLPGQTNKELLENLKLVLGEGATIANNIFTPVPKSYLYETNERFKSMDLEMLAPQLMPSMETQEQWDELQAIMDVFLTDSHSLKKAFLDKALKKEGAMGSEKDNKGAASPGPQQGSVDDTKKKSMLAQMAILLADIAEQNQTIIALLKKVLEQKDK